MKILVIFFTFSISTCTPLDTQQLEKSPKYIDGNHSKGSSSSNFQRIYLRSSTDVYEIGRGNTGDGLLSLIQHHLWSFVRWLSGSKDEVVRSDDDIDDDEKDYLMISDESLIRYLMGRNDDDFSSCEEVTYEKKLKLKTHGGRKSHTHLHAEDDEEDDRIYKLDFDLHICPSLGKVVCNRAGSGIRDKYNAGLLNCNDIGFLFKQQKRKKLKKIRQREAAAALSATDSSIEDNVRLREAAIDNTAAVPLTAADTQVEDAARQRASRITKKDADNTGRVG